MSCIFCELYIYFTYVQSTGAGWPNSAIAGNAIEPLETDEYSELFKTKYGLVMKITNYVCFVLYLQNGHT